MGRVCRLVLRKLFKAHYYSSGIFALVMLSGVFDR